jgi:hypothetical protein
MEVVYVKDLTGTYSFIIPIENNISISFILKCVVHVKMDNPLLMNATSLY